MSARGDVLRIQSWLLNVSRPIYLSLIAFALLSWTEALILALEFPTGVGPRLLWVLNAVVIAMAWTPHVYFAVARPQITHMNVAETPLVVRSARATSRLDSSPVALAAYRLAISASLALLLVSWWPDSVAPLASLPVLAMPAVVLAAWVVKYTRPRT